MIPKIIHYCWLSGDKMSQRTLDCIASWREVMPDYEFMLWDADRFDIRSTGWTEQACRVKKWAYAADYIRLYALYHHGGIYMDTDVRVLKRFDEFLADKAFCGIEFIQDVYEVLNRGTADTYKLGINLEAALIGAEKGSPVIREFMKYYESHDFILPDGNLNYALIPRVMNEVAEGMGYAYKWNEHQLLDNGLHIYPYDYFTTQAGKTEGRDCSVTHRTAAIHLCTGSWIPVDKDRKPHSRYTEWRLLTVKYFKDLWKYVVRHKYDK